MILYPDVARKAQAEIDAVVGQDRLPSFDDRERLPYINAVVLEVIRWHSVVPTGNLLTPWFCPSITYNFTRFPSSCHGGQHPWRLYDTKRGSNNPECLVEKIRSTKRVIIDVCGFFSGSWRTIHRFTQTHLGLIPRDFWAHNRNKTLVVFPSGLVEGMIVLQVSSLCTDFELSGFVLVSPATSIFSRSSIFTLSYNRSNFS